MLSNKNSIKQPEGYGPVLRSKDSPVVRLGKVYFWLHTHSKWYEVWETWLKREEGGVGSIDNCRGQTKQTVTVDRLKKAEKCELDSRFLGENGSPPLLSTNSGVFILKERGCVIKNKGKRRGCQGKRNKEKTAARNKEQ